MSATLLVAALAVAHPATMWEPVKFQPKPGTKLSYKSTSNTAFEGMGMAMNTVSKDTTTIEVEAGENGWVRVKTTINEYSTDSEMDMGMAPDPTGLSTSVLVSPTRAQKEFKVVANGKMTTDQIDILKGRTKEDLESGFEGLTLPGGDIKVGTMWSLEHAPAGIGMSGMRSTTTGRLKTEYKVVEVDGTGADRTIVIESKSGGSFKMDMEVQPGTTLAFDVKANETGKYRVRATDGVVLKAELTSSMDMNSDVGQFVTKTTTVRELQKS